MKHFVPTSPDPALKKHKGDGALARFGHLNVIVDKLNEFDASQTIVSASPSTLLIVGFNLITTATPGNVQLPCLSALCACTGGCGPVAPVIVKNGDLVNSLTILACGTETINGLASVVIAPGNSIEITAMDCTTWQSYADAAGSPGPAGPLSCVATPGVTQALTGTG